jgi:hypothetical protein
MAAEAGSLAEDPQTADLKGRHEADGGGWNDHRRSLFGDLGLEALAKPIEYREIHLLESVESELSLGKQRYQFKEVQ